MSTPPAGLPTADASGTGRRWLPAVAAVLFAVAHTQSPLYYSNQNQYFLHGLAAAEYGDLRSDWLASRTTDPTPVFSIGVEWGYRLGGGWPFHAAYFALLVVYFLGLWGVARAFPFAPRTLAGQVALAAGLVVVHAAVVRVGSVQAVGVDYPWYLQAGVANQYLLGPGLQPSAFGVFLLAALAAYARGRPVAAAVLCAAACAVHSTYLLPAGLLVAGMLVGLWRAGRPLAAAVTGGVALAGVGPVVVFVAVAFAPTDPDGFADAQRTVAWVRIPHHADPDRWLDGVAVAQLVWAAGGIAAARRSPLLPVLLVAAGAGLALSLVAALTRSPTFALLFPWRVSAVLVPVATAAAVAGLARVAERYAPAWAVWVGAVLLTLAAVAGAGVVYARGLGYQQTPAENGLVRFVSDTRQPGDVYLLPAGYPPPPKSRGTAAQTFVPVSQATFELQRFRLATGAAAYVDFKAIPYRDDEVREWRRRVDQAAAWYATPDWDAAGVTDAVAAAGVTHVVVPAGRAVRSARLVEVYADPSYRVYRLDRPP